MIRWLRQFSLSLRWVIFLIIPAVILVLLFTLVSPIPQWEGYHAFADQRALLGVKNFADVFSNALFPLAAIAGWWVLARVEHLRPSRWIWVLFFLAIAGVGVGSAYYHYDPNNDTLLWDRIPIAIGSGFLFWALLIDRISGLPSWLLGAAWLLLSIAALLWWWLGQLTGTGDLRLYGFVTIYPICGILLLWIFWPPRYAGQAWVMAALALYALSRIAELGDAVTFTTTGELISGHTLKHILAAAAVFCLAASLKEK